MKARVLLICLFLASCTYLPQNSDDRDHFTGREGVEIQFESNSPPRELFVRSGQGTNFSVDVRVRNRGASLAKGGLYVSGYDPTIIDIQEVDEDDSTFEDCMFSIDSIAYGGFQGLVQCREINILGSDSQLGVSFGDQGLIIDIRDFNLGAALDGLFGGTTFQDLGMDSTNIRFSTGDGGTRLDVDFNNPLFDPKKGDRGAYFMQLWEPIDFTLNYGKEFQVFGDVPQAPGEAEEFVTFQGTVLGLPPGRTQTTQPIMVTSCYLYVTHASPTVCIDRDPYSEVEKVCRPTVYTGTRGQGAPVAITSVTQRGTGQESVFRIEIQNVGNGKVFDPTQILRCSPYYPRPLTEESLDRVVVGMVYIGEDHLECVPDQHMVQMYNGRGIINCVYPLEEAGLISRSGFETPLVVEMWYGYSETIRRDITIQSVMS